MARGDLDAVGVAGMEPTFGDLGDYTIIFDRKTYQPLGMNWTGSPDS